MEVGQDLGDVAGVGIRFREGEPDLARRKTQAGPDFQQLQTDRRALGLGKRRTGTWSEKISPQSTNPLFEVRIIEAFS